MELEKAIHIALDGDAILLTGSGFSYGAKSIRKKRSHAIMTLTPSAASSVAPNPSVASTTAVKEIAENTKATKGTETEEDFESIPLGNGLTNILLDRLGMLSDNSASTPTNTTVQQDLGDVSNFFIKKKSKNELIQILRECFTVSSVAEHHKGIMNIDWRRIYTTNYDKVAEIAATSVGKNYKTVSMDDAFEGNKTGICVHINGTIDELDENTLNSSFKLTNRSYNFESLTNNPWFDFMARNFQNAKAIFIVGFSMKFDLDIRRVISSIADKKTIVFVTSASLSEIDRSSLEDYGTVCPIGVECLADEIEKVAKIHVPKVSLTSPISGDTGSSGATRYDFTSFIHYNHRDVAIKDDTSLTDIMAFYSYGKIKDSILVKTTPGRGKYIVYRNQLQKILHNWRIKRAFIVSSYLGNGKTVFCHELVEELRNKDIDVFYLSDETEDISYEIEAICKIKQRCVVIVDDFYKHYDTLSDFATYDCKNITFILTGRIAKEENNIRKVKKQLNLNIRDIFTIYLDRISKSECYDLAFAMKKENFIPKPLIGKTEKEISSYLQNECKSRIVNIVLCLYESWPVKEELNKLYTNAVRSNSELKELAITTICNTAMCLGLSKYDIGSIHNIDYVAAELNAPELFSELFGDNRDENGTEGTWKGRDATKYVARITKLNSSIVAREILYNVIDNADTITTLTKVAEYADKNRNLHSKFKEVLTALVSHNNFASSRYKFKLSYAKKFYENIRNLEFFRENPFFWEQFALMCMDIEDFQTAHQCIHNAYAKGEKIKGFVPFQICTVEAELIVTEEIYKLSTMLPNVATTTSTNVWGYGSSENKSTEIGKHTGDLIKMVAEASAIIGKAKSKLLQHYDHEENNKGYVFTIANKITKLYDKVKIYFTDREHSNYIKDLSELKDKMDVYAESDEGMRIYDFPNNQTAIKQSIEEARNLLRKYRDRKVH